MPENKLVELTAEIVASHVASNNVAVGDVAALIHRVYEALAGLGQTTAGGEQPAEKSPVVSVRSSVRPDYLVCMECGRKQKTLKRHLATAHGMSPEQYRQDYGLPASYPMVARNYSDQRRSLAHSIGLGRKRGGDEQSAAAEGEAAPARKRRSPRKAPEPA